MSVRLGDLAEPLLKRCGKPGETPSEVCRRWTLHGNPQGWIDAEFSADDADEWMDAGWWDADRAASARDLGLTPSQTSERSQALIDACGDDREAAAAHYTDGDPIYSICNGDTSLNVLVPA